MNEQNNTAKKNKINFIIPDFLNVDECTYLLSTFKEHPEIFKEDINIIGFCGQFNGCVWNTKDKKFNRYRLNIEYLKEIKNKYNDELRTSLIIMFDNENIENRDLDDEYSNELIEIFNNNQNYVLCKSKKLRNYIKEKYNKIKIIDYYEDEDNNSDYLLLNENYNNKASIFNEKYKDKFIMMPDTGFIPNKRWLFKHSVKDSILNKINPKKDKYYSKETVATFNEIKRKNSYLNYEKIKKYAGYGITTYMLSGLGVYNIAMIENIVDYLYKEEYKMDARIILYRKILALKEQNQNAIFQYRL